MGVPFGRFLIDLSTQRRIDALECLELPIITSEEARLVNQGLIKQNILFLCNRMGFVLLVYLFYKGRLLEGGRHNGASIPRVILGATIAMNYLDVGDYLAADLLWNDCKYIFYKYEPLIRKMRQLRHARFKTDPAIG